MYHIGGGERAIKAFSTLRKYLKSALRKSTPWRKILFAEDEERIPTPSSFEPKDFYELYSRVLWAYLGINTVAQAAAQVPLVLYLSTPRGKVQVLCHPLLELLKRPNSHDTQFKLFWRTYSFILLAGNAFWKLDKPNEPTSVEVIRPDRVVIQKLEDGTLRYKIRRSDDAVNPDYEEVPDEQMLHFSTFNPNSPLVGIGNMSPSSDLLIIDLYLLKYDKTYYENAERPTKVITMPEGMYLDEQTFKRLKQELANLHRGVGKFHGTAVLEGGMDIKELKNPSHADTDFVRHKKLIREEILAAFGCWPLIAILKDSSNRALLAQAYRMFYDLTVMPLAESVRQELNRDLLPRYKYGDLYELVFRYQLLKGLRDDLLDVSSAAYRLVQLGIMVPNEVRRELLNLHEPVPWGDRPPRTAAYAMPQTMFEPNENKQIMEPQERAGSLVEHELEASGVMDELRRLMRMEGEG